MARVQWLRKAAAAVERARVAILTIALTYVLFIVLGIVMVHTGIASALDYRDRLVANALKHDAASLSYAGGDHLRAAAWDWFGNAAMGVATMTVSGLAIVPPYLLVAYQG